MAYWSKNQIKPYVDSSQCSIVLLAEQLNSTLKSLKFKKLFSYCSERTSVQFVDETFAFRKTILCILSAWRQLLVSLKLSSAVPSRLLLGTLMGSAETALCHVTQCLKPWAFIISVIELRSSEVSWACTVSCVAQPGRISSITDTRGSHRFRRLPVIYACLV